MAGVIRPQVSQEPYESGEKSSTAPVALEVSK
jgi:hypothetical protein